jgi:polyhydroxyalkanoate synthase
VNDKPRNTLESFVEGATEHKGSWWPDWLAWIRKQDGETVKASGARVPGKGKLKVVEEAPGTYVKSR